MPFIAGDSVSLLGVERFSTSAEAAIEAIVTAVIPAVRQRGVVNAGKPIGNTNKVRKGGSTIATVSGSGAGVEAV